MDRRNWAGRINIEKSSSMDPRLWANSNNIEKSSAMDPRICDIIEKPPAIEYPRDKEGYDYYKLIGGGNGIVNVFKAVCRPLDFALVAIKIVDIEKTEIYFDHVFARAKIMTYLNHNNILSAHCVFTATRCLWVVMPFIPGGSFQTIISESYPDGLPEHYIAAILHQVLCGLQYLHDEGFAHGNIKPGNILIDCDGTVTLADFASAAINHDCDPSKDADGTPSYWIAPELRNKALSPEADMWSFGITAMELAYGSRVPLSQKPTSKSLLKKISKRFRYTEHYDKEKSDMKGCYFSGAFKDMVGWCLHENPSERPTVEDLLTHPFFRNCHIPSFLVENLLMDLPHDVEQRFKEAESKRVTRFNREHEVSSPVGENADEKKINGWKFNRKEFELDPVFEGAIVNTNGKDCVENGGITGTVNIDDKNVSINGTVKIDKNLGTNGTVTADGNYDNGKRFDGEKELVQQIKELKEVMSAFAFELKSLKAINSKASS